MKILLVAPIHNYSEYFKQKKKTEFLVGSGQESWVRAFRKLGHEVISFKYTDSAVFPTRSQIILEKLSPSYSLQFQKYNRVQDKFYFLLPENYIKNYKLLMIAIKKKPDIIILSGGFNFLFTETVSRIKKTLNCKILLFSGVNPQVAGTKSERSLISNSLIDVVVENDIRYEGEWRKLGAKKTLVLPISSVDTALHKRYMLSKKEKELLGSDVTFVGSILQERANFLSRLSEFNLKVWGDVKPGVTLPKKLLPCYMGQARGEKMIKIFNASKIILNIQPLDMKKGGNMRTFEILGSGGFQLADKCNEDWFKDRQHLVRFSTIADAKKKIGYYLKNEKERMRISKNGYQEAVKYHTYEKHFKKLLQQI